MDKSNIKGANVLLVEDNPINQQVATEILKNAGVKVTIANNGKEGVKTVCDNPASMFHIVLMDVQMPEMDGHEASREIRKNPLFEKLPIIAMTAHAMKGDKEACLAAGMNDYVTKPINPEILFSTMSKWIKLSKRTEEIIGDNLQQSMDSAFIENNDIEKSKKVEQENNELLKADILQTEIVNNDLILNNLPSTLPGIDVAEGINRLGGNIKLFLKLYSDFAKDYSGAVNKIKQLISNEQKEEAKRLTHSIKGVAGNLGATQLQSIGQKLESGIADWDKEKFDELILHFDKELKQVLESIKKISQKEPKEIILNTNDDKKPLDFKTVKLDIEKLGVFIEENDPVGCEECLSLLKRKITSHIDSELLESLETHIDNYDFIGAEETLQNIKKVIVLL